MSKTWTNSETFKRLQREDPFFYYDEEDYSGIYIISNVINNKVYIGQSRDLSSRIRSHKKDLRGKYHRNRYLQSSWNKYGEENFSFNILTYCRFSELYKWETFWIDAYDSWDRECGYNLMIPNANSSSFSHSEESKKIQSDKLKIVMIKYSDEELLSYLQEFYYMEGRLPITRGDLIERNGYPSVGTYENRFGSMKEAFTQAGLYYAVDNKKLFNRKIITKEGVIENYREFANKHGRFPSTDEQRSTNTSNLYGYSSVLKVFNSIQELKDILGFTKEKELQEENNASLIALMELYKANNGIIDSRIIDKSRVTRSVKFYANRFGSLSRAYELAGITFDKHRLSIPIVQLSKDGLFIKEWESATEAHKETGIASANISHSLKGRNEFAGGYKWIYKE